MQNITSKLLHVLISGLALLLLQGCLDDSLTFQLQFPKISGLRTDEKVLFQENEIGTVKKITYTDQGDYLVEVNIESGFTNAATSASRFYIDQPPGHPSMAVIVEQQQPGGTPIQNGSIIRGSIRPGYLERLLPDLQKHVGEVEKELNKALEDIKQSLNMTSETLSRELETAIKDISSQINSFQNELETVPDSEEVKGIEESVREFVDEFNRAQKEVQDQVRDEILPRLRQELEELRKQLQNEGREQEMERIDIEVKELEMV